MPLRRRTIIQPFDRLLVGFVGIHPTYRTDIGNRTMMCAEKAPDLVVKRRDPLLARDRRLDEMAIFLHDVGLFLSQLKLANLLGPSMMRFDLNRLNSPPRHHRAAPQPGITGLVLIPLGPDRLGHDHLVRARTKRHEELAAMP